MLIIKTTSVFNGGGFLNPKLISTNPQKAYAIKQAFIEAIQIINTKPKRAYQILSKKLNSSDSIAFNAVYDKFHIPDVNVPGQTYITDR